MSPIIGLSSVLRLPRLGKIHLGVKIPNKSGVGDHPVATDYFVFPADYLRDVKRVCGTDKPDKLSVIIPVDDEAIFASQFYRAYSLTRGCICRGDGETANQVQDAATHQLVSSSAAKAERVQIPCPGKACPIYQTKKCGEVMCLQFMLPDFPGLGVWQIDTGSINSIININSDIEMVRGVIGRIRLVPLTLSLEPQEVISPEDGKRKMVRCLHLRASGSLGQLLQAAKTPLARFTLPEPETGALPPVDTPSVDEDGVIDEDIPFPQEEEDLLAAWTGSSRPAQAIKNGHENLSTVHSPSEGQKTPAAQPDAGESIQSALPPPSRIKPLRYAYMQRLADKNWTALTQEIQKRNHCLPSELVTERGEYYINLLEKRNINLLEKRNAK